MMMRALGFPHKEDTSYQVYMKLEYRNIWFYNGAKRTYQAWNKLSAGKQGQIKAWLQNLPLEYDVETEKGKFKLVHAAPVCLYDAYNTNYADALEYAVWDRDTLGYLPDVDDRTVLFGHTITGNFTDEFMNCSVVAFGREDDRSRWIGIDCGAGLADDEPGYRGRLACVNLDTLDVEYTGSVSVSEMGMVS